MIRPAKVDEGFWWDVQHDGAHIRMGLMPKGERYIIEWLLRLLKMGHNVIVDEVCDQERFLNGGKNWRLIKSFTCMLPHHLMF